MSNAAESLPCSCDPPSVLPRIFCWISRLLHRSVAGEFSFTIPTFFIQNFSLQCKWPKTNVTAKLETPVKVMLFADPHLLGPFRGHWLDKLRREWQMHRTFQSALTIFRPEIIFLLGDVFDEGKWVNDNQFRDYLDRYFRIFSTHGSTTKLYSVVGNHDIGFHYAAHPYLTERFYREMNTSGVQLLSVNDVHFVTINSVAMEGDGCMLCERAERELIRISYQMECAQGVGSCDKVQKIKGSYSRPVILQHYPFYRQSDEICQQTDIGEMEKYREGWEVLSKDATKLINKLLKPRVGFSGHSHHYCHLRNRLMSNMDEYTLASFSWRNKNNPSFLLVRHFFSRKCDKLKLSLFCRPSSQSPVMRYSSVTCRKRRPSLLATLLEHFLHLSCRASNSRV